MIPEYNEELKLPEKISVLYVLFSKGDSDSNSAAKQKSALTKLAKDNDLQNPVFFVDNGVSGETFDRPNLQSALSLLEYGRVKNFAVMNLSRFGQNRIEVDFYHEVVFYELKVRFFSIDDKIDSAKNKHASQLRDLFYKWNSLKLSYKVRTTALAKSMAGKRTSPYMLYGYKKSPCDPQKWIIDKEVSEIVKRVYRMFLDGQYIAKIVKTLRDEKIPSPSEYSAKIGAKNQYNSCSRTRPWEHMAVARILERREYLGHTINFKHRKKFIGSKITVPTTPENHKIIKNTHPAIIDEKTFERVQKMRSRKKTRSVIDRVSLVSGVVFCAECKSKMSMRRRGGVDDSSLDSFSCMGFCKKKTNCSSSHHIRDSHLVKMVVEHLDEVRNLATQHEEIFTSLALKNAKTADVKRFLKLVREQSKIKELTPSILAKWVERVEVDKQILVSGEQAQKATVYFNHIGAIDKTELSAVKSKIN
jgi:hypothetical protein